LSFGVSRVLRIGCTAEERQASAIAKVAVCNLVGFVALRPHLRALVLVVVLFVVFLVFAAVIIISADDIGDGRRAGLEVPGSRPAGQPILETSPKMQSITGNRRGSSKHTGVVPAVVQTATSF
jgi:hypothetical protein